MPPDKHSRVVARGSPDNEQPVRDRVLEKEYPKQLGWAFWKVQDQDTGDETAVLGDEIIAKLSDEKQRYQAESLEKIAVALCRFVEHEHYVFCTGLSPALCPPQSLIPEGFQCRGGELVRDYVHVVDGLSSSRDGSERRIDVLGQHIAIHLEIA